MPGPTAVLCEELGSYTFGAPELVHWVLGRLPVTPACCPEKDILWFRSDSTLVELSNKVVYSDYFIRSSLFR